MQEGQTRGSDDGCPEGHIGGCVLVEESESFAIHVDGGEVEEYFSFGNEVVL